MKIFKTNSGDILVSKRIAKLITLPETTSDNLAWMQHKNSIINLSTGKRTILVNSDRKIANFINNL